MSSSWGRVTSERIIGNGVRLVSCEGHGGILISNEAMKNQPFLAKLKDYPLLKSFSGRGGYEFEEDCDSSIVLFALGKSLYQRVFNISDDEIQRKWDSIIKSLICWNPDVYTHMTGIGLDIFGSYKLLEQHLQECGNDVYKFNGSYQPDQFNVPKGMRVLNVFHLRLDNVVKFFLLTEQQYQEIYRFRHFPIDITGLQEVQRPVRITA